MSSTLTSFSFFSNRAASRSRARFDFGLADFALAFLAFGVRFPLGASAAVSAAGAAVVSAALPRERFLRDFFGGDASTGAVSVAVAASVAARRLLRLAAFFVGLVSGWAAGFVAAARRGRFAAAAFFVAFLVPAPVAFFATFRAVFPAGAFFAALRAVFLAAAFFLGVRAVFLAAVFLVALRAVFLPAAFFIALRAVFLRAAFFVALRATFLVALRAVFFGVAFFAARLPAPALVGFFGDRLAVDFLVLRFGARFVAAFFAARFALLFFVARFAAVFFVVPRFAGLFRVGRLAVRLVVVRLRVAFLAARLAPALRAVRRAALVALPVAARPRLAVRFAALFVFLAAARFAVLFAALFVGFFAAVFFRGELVARFLGVARFRALLRALFFVAFAVDRFVVRAGFDVFRAVVFFFDRVAALLRVFFAGLRALVAFFPTPARLGIITSYTLPQRSERDVSDARAR